MIIEWTDVYRLGIPEMDAQHRRLVDLINQLGEAHKNRALRQEVHSILLELYDYTDYHFSTEEGLFLSDGNGAFDAHIKGHKLFVSKIAKFGRDLEQGKATVSIDMILYLKDWILKHILVEDKRYADAYLNGEALKP